METANIPMDCTVPGHLKRAWGGGGGCTHRLAGSIGKRLKTAMATRALAELPAAAIGAKRERFGCERVRVRPRMVMMQAIVSGVTENKPVVVVLVAIAI